MSKTSYQVQIHDIYTKLNPCLQWMVYPLKLSISFLTFFYYSILALCFKYSNKEQIILDTLIINTDGSSVRYIKGINDDNNNDDNQSPNIRAIKTVRSFNNLTIETSKNIPIKRKRSLSDSSLNS